MLTKTQKELLTRLDLKYPAIALKTRFEIPPVSPHYTGEKLAFCQYIKHAQTSGERFYICVDDDACYGKLAMGMIDIPPVTGSGQAGYDFGCCQSAALPKASPSAQEHGQLCRILSRRSMRL